MSAKLSPSEKQRKSKFKQRISKKLYERTCNQMARALKLLHELAEAERETFGYIHNDFGQRLVQAIDYAEELIPYEEYRRIMKNEFNNNGLEK